MHGLQVSGLRLIVSPVLVATVARPDSLPGGLTLLIFFRILLVMPSPTSLPAALLPAEGSGYKYMSDLKGPTRTLLADFRECFESAAYALSSSLSSAAGSVKARCEAAFIIVLPIAQEISTIWGKVTDA